jgi:hypothetical protein
MLHVHLKAKGGTLDSSEYDSYLSRVMVHARGFGCSHWVKVVRFGVVRTLSSMV